MSSTGQRGLIETKRDGPESDSQMNSHKGLNLLDGPVQFKKDWKRQRLIWPRNSQHQTSLPFISGQECGHSTGRDSAIHVPFGPRHFGASPFSSPCLPQRKKQSGQSIRP